MRLDARSLACVVVDATQAGEARRLAAQLAERIGLDETARGKIGILVTELANNLHKHAKNGVILLRSAGHEDPALEILAIDRGPGMADVAKCFRDGYSTTGTPGTGLGSVKRLADHWDVYSLPGSGTVLMAQIGMKKNGRISPLEIGSVTLPTAGEVQCGDNWAYFWNASRATVMMTDGLGHGQFAAEASDEAEVIFREKQGHPLIELMQAIHNGLKKTRGVAMAITELDFERRLIRHVAMGNIAATVIVDGTTRSLVSQNGIVGHDTRRFQEYQYPWPEGALLVMNSDGILTRWDLSQRPGLALRHPALVAATLWRDFARGRDDASVIAVREKARR